MPRSNRNDGRNKALSKKVLNRDSCLCDCCGLEASEVHHVIPLCFGGEDSKENMVSLCHTCHKYAPDSLEEYQEYKRLRGARTWLALGKAFKFLVLENQLTKKNLKLMIEMEETMRVFCRDCKEEEKYQFQEKLLQYLQ